MELWKAVAGYEGLYEVSDQGRVKSIGNNKYRKEKLLKLCNTANGYLLVVLSKDGHKKTVKVHRLVADAFVPNPLGLETINHKDEIKTNNSADNLEWMTRGDNKRYSANKPVQMLDKSTGELLATFPSTREAQRVTMIKQSNISSCCIGKRKSAGGYKWQYML